MPDELTDAQLEELHADLLALRDSLRKTLATTNQAAETVHLDQTAVGRVSRIDAIQHQAMAQEQLRRNELRLKQVAVALQTYADDDYGWCKKCGEPVGYGRLKARPETVVCVPCMRELEEGR